MQTSNPGHVAIVGSGPSGFYAAEALLAAHADTRVELIERLPVPFGLVRYGVAPDHQKLKEVARVFTALARNPRLRFVGNVAVGRDVSVDQLLDCYDAVIIASGAAGDRLMQVPGEHLAGSHPAGAFVGWYNSHPDHASHQFDLSGDTASIVGHGNVAIDLCRVLSKGAPALGTSDIAGHALAVLANAKIKHIHLIGRRGPAQMKFTAKELRELGELPDWDIAVDPDALNLNEASTVEMAQPRSAAAARNIQFLREMSQRPRGSGRVIEFHFLRSPVEILGDRAVEAITLGKNALTGEPFRQRTASTGESETIKTDLVFRSIGYAGEPFPGLPFDKSLGIIPHLQGRVLESGVPRARTYVTGWIKRGPTGIIGTNRADSIETVASLLADFSGRAPAKTTHTSLHDLLRAKNIHVTGFDEWLAIDAEELRRGATNGQVRSKIASIDELLAIGASGKRDLVLSHAHSSPPRPSLS